MTFNHDPAYAAEVGTVYGEYKDTYSSDNNQVSAILFASGNQLTAYISFTPGYSFENVTDKYLGDLKTYADKKGFGDNLVVKYSEN